MIADHHNVADTTMWDVFAVVAVAICVTVGIMLKRLLDESE